MKLDRWIVKEKVKRNRLDIGIAIIKMHKQFLVLVTVLKRNNL